ncbi:hypothetical protein [Segetibacter koreensis]|uniref:hypothetical protein n=1 Tax=Segetibacter koreensis TaxID=398037 RepID=UPI000368CA08|nr:hypothetical protein [Segetibacter koreensis]
MKKLSAFLSVASGVFAVIPGITVMISNVGVPPNSSKTLFAATIEALGVLTLMLMWLNKEWIKQKSLQTITRISVYSIGIFLLSLFAYIFLYGYLVVDVENSNSLFFPLWAEGELKTYLEKFGSRPELIRQWGRDDVYKVIQSSSTVPLLFTTILLLIIYQLIFVSLTFSFGILGIKGDTE